MAMKRKGIRKELFFILAAFLIAGAAGMLAFAQSADRKEYITSYTLFDFESTEGWNVRGSKNFYEGAFTNAETGKEYTLPILRAVEGFPQAMGIQSNNTTNSLSITVGFKRRGYNFFDLYRTAEAPRAIIPGIAKSMNVWVWGGNFKYNADIYLEDYRGYAHVIPMGSLAYRGWRNLEVRVPSTVPQVEEYAPRIKGLTVAFIRFTSDPGERPERFHVFLDHFVVNTDLYSEYYDGNSLENELMKDIGGDERVGNPNAR